MIMRIALAATALALAASTAPATAVPPDIQEGLTTWAQLWVDGQDGVGYRVFLNTVLARRTYSGTPFSAIGIRVVRCPRGHCQFEDVYFVTELSPSQYDIRDEKKISIRLNAFGKPMAVTWTGPGASLPVTSAFPGGTYNAVYSTWDATARVTMLGRTCSVTNAGAGRITSMWTTGRPQSSYPPAPNRPTAGVPTKARSCRTQ
jgi:hypothetical protein